MEQNKTGKYFKYAIGEIVLVVIGILIALQINNWNEANKTKQLETKILKELHSNLTLDLKEIQHDIATMDSIVKACKDLNDYIKTQETPDSKFNYSATLLRVIPHFDPNKSGYGLLQSKGVEVISNDSLRNNVSLLYERAYPYYRRYEDERLDFFNLNTQPKLLEYFYKNFDSTATWYANYKITQSDYERLKADESFSRLLSTIAFENAGVQNRAKRTEGQIKNLLQFINEELNSIHK